jgi:predicted glutamine amidotransferase
MCGLVGIVGNVLDQTHYEAFKWMLLFDTTRGEDSTGVAFRKVNYKTQKSAVTLLKTEGLPYNLYRKFPEVFSDKGVFKNTTSATDKISFLMGHNRAATIGLVNSLNAHPFHHGHITGCHNGTVRTGLISLDKGPEIQGSTDSEQIFYNLSKGKTLQQIIDTITGGTALTWWDSKQSTYNIYRNSERTMHYAIDPITKTLFYASEPWILRAAFANSKLVTMTQHIKELEAHKHVVIQFDNNIVDSITEYDAKPTPVPARVVAPSNNMKPKVPEFLKQNKGKRETPFRSQTGWLEFPNLSKEEFQHNARFGCAMCGCDLDFIDYSSKKVKWMERESPFCEHCSSEFNVA